MAELKELVAAIRNDQSLSEHEVDDRIQELVNGGFTIEQIVAASDELAAQEKSAYDAAIEDGIVTEAEFDGLTQEYQDLAIQDALLSVQSEEAKQQENAAINERIDARKGVTYDTDLLKVIAETYHNTGNQEKRVDIEGTWRADEINSTENPRSASSKITSGRGDDTITVNDRDTLIDAGKGDDTIIVQAQTQDAYVDGGKGDDTVKLVSNTTGGTTVVDVSQGNDTVDILVTGQESTSNVRDEIVIAGAAAGDTFTLDMTQANINAGQLDEVLAAANVTLNGVKLDSLNPENVDIQSVGGKVTSVEIQMG